MEELLNTRQAAELLGMKFNTLNTWRFQGIGPMYIKVGLRAIRYRPEDLREYMRIKQVKHEIHERKLKEKERLYWEYLSTLD